MQQSDRLTKGGRINRDKHLSFTFNNQRYQGYAGDTLASALLANGKRLLGRSFKYHRPRGVVGNGAEEPNGIVQLGEGPTSEPNQRATQVELFEGLIARSVNCWPSVNFDLYAWAGWFSRLLPAGFYYKTFMWPRRLWPFYERIIRHSAGLGEAPENPDPDYYDTLNAHCDVLVVGSGPAGLCAALAAGRLGARVILADERAEFGGSLLYTRPVIDGMPGYAWVKQTLDELRSLPEVTLLPRSTVFGYYDHNFLGIAERLTDHLPENQRQGPRQRYWRVRAKRVILATGAIERPLVFANNDRPGVMLASAVSAYVNQYAVRLGKRVVVFTNNDSAYQTALDLLSAGIKVIAIIDNRDHPDGALVLQARQAGIEILTGSLVTDVTGSRSVTGATISRMDSSSTGGSERNKQVECDLIAVSGGWNPAVHLHSHAGGKNRWDEEKMCFIPSDTLQRCVSAGAANGSFALTHCLSEGVAAGTEAARLSGFDVTLDLAPVTDEMNEAPIQALWRASVPNGSSGKMPMQFVDLQNDTTAGDIELAVREGYSAIEHLKRYTLLGFGTDQGKLGNINGMAILATELGQDIAAVGTTTFRPMYTPTTIGNIAGIDVQGRFDPVRKTALHKWHVEHGALFENVDQWKRPWYYSKTDESMQDAVNRECLAARNGVAIVDASTLGKIDVRGPDAAEFLDRIYTNSWENLAIGRCRYGLMLGDDGMIMDDGVTARIAEDRYYMTTTTGGAASIMAWLERWLQTEWPELKVRLTSLTDHWATIALVGPESRKVVSTLSKDIDFSQEAFPFMAVREGHVAGVNARVFRISFSGELSYEINIPANFAQAVWTALMKAGEAFGITPYGTEAMHVLRAEKGYIIVGQDTDGSMTPADMGMGWIVSKNKDFLGKRSLSRSDCLRADRKQLVGLLADKHSVMLPQGGQIVLDPNAGIPIPMEGHVTSSYYSICLKKNIALAMVKAGRNRMGERVTIPLAKPGKMLTATITDPVFYDPQGARQNV